MCEGFWGELGEVGVGERLFVEDFGGEFLDSFLGG